MYTSDSSRNYETATVTFPLKYSNAR